jgi:dihydrofolate reductase
MRPVRYNVAASLDGYIAGPHGEYDWIPNDPSVDFAALFAKVDTVLLGRRSFEVALNSPETFWAPGTRVYVASRTLTPEQFPNVTILREEVGHAVAALRAEPGDGEIWCFGGGDLFRTLLAARQVDTVEITFVPILLGGGVPLVQPGAPRTALKLTSTQTYPSGMVTLTYAVESTNQPLIPERRHLE